MTTTWEVSDARDDEILIMLQWTGKDACPSADWPKKILEKLSQEGFLIDAKVKRGFFWWFMAYLNFNAMDSALPHHVIDLMRKWCGVPDNACEGHLVWGTGDL